jgi:hypothetical protein
MQTRVRWMIVIGLGGFMTAGNAIAVAPGHSAASAGSGAPKQSVAYSGTGTDYMNDATGWTAAAMGAISFRTSPSGKSVLGFRGGYSFYCGSGTATVTERRMSIARSGRFGAKFKVPNKGPNGKRNGTAYVQISGAFDPSRTAAIVSYLVDYVFKGRHVKHPYDTGQPSRLGCASWVKGTATTTTSSASSPPTQTPHPHPQPHPPTGQQKATATAARSRLLSS